MDVTQSRLISLNIRTGPIEQLHIKEEPVEESTQMDHVSPIIPAPCETQFQIKSILQNPNVDSLNSNVASITEVVFEPLDGPSNVHESFKSEAMVTLFQKDDSLKESSSTIISAKNAKNTKCTSNEESDTQTDFRLLSSPIEFKAGIESCTSKTAAMTNNNKKDRTKERFKNSSFD